MKQRILIVCLLILPISNLTGCVTMPSKADTDLQRVKNERLKQAEKYGDDAIVWEQRFLTCMTGYAETRWSVNASPTEIAEAGVSRCQTELDNFIVLRRGFYQMLDGNTAKSLDHYEYLLQQAALKASKEGEDLVTRGKQKAIANILDLKATTVN